MRPVRHWLGLRCVSLVLAALAVAAWSTPAAAYLKFGYEVNGRDITLKWTGRPVRYFVTEAGVPGVSAPQLRDAVASAFATWEAVPSASITYQFAGYTRSLPGEDDGRSTLGFLSQPELDRVLASTSYLIDERTGELLESDIFFNAAFAWSVAPTGERGLWDLQSVALHEIGHMSGLGHSALGETELVAGGGRRVTSSGAVMFPIALGTGDTTGRRLRPDDIAGISDLYPDGEFMRSTGTVSGHITRSGRGVFGAHVVAFDTVTGDMIGNFSLDTEGVFSIAGLRPGAWVIRVEPLDDAEPASFFDAAVPIDANFRVRFADRLAIVPRGGDSGAVDVRVVAK